MHPVALLLSLSFMTFFGQTAAWSKNYILSPGKSLFVKAPEKVAIEVEDSKVVSVKDLGEKIQVTARKIGETELTVGSQDNHIQVVSKTVFQTVERLHQHFQSWPHLEVQYKGSRIFLSAQVNNIEQWLKIWNLPSVMERWQASLRVSDEIKTSIQENLEQVLHQHRLPMAILTYSPTLTVLVSSENKSFLPLYEHILQPYGFSVVLHPDTLQAEPMLRLKIIISEIKKGYLQKFGLQWPSQLRAQIVPKFLWDDSSEASLMQLDLLESRGIGKMLAAPSLLCQSGQEAEFMAGGEIPIPTSFGHDILWKKHGILLKIKPLIALNGHVQIELMTEISSLDFSAAIDGIPGLASTRLATVFNFEKPEPIVLSGLFKKDIGNQTDGLPWLSRLPIIGPLFSSRSYLDNQTELVIVVIPEKMSPDNDSQTTPPEKLSGHSD